MPSLNHTITIHAPKTHVYQLMLADKSYREWTSEFAQGSYYQGTWNKGAQILFLAPGGGGMNARIAENKPAEFVSIEMLSEVRDGVPNTLRQWHDVFENYTFSETQGITTLQVEISGVPNEWAEDLNTKWPKALAKLKVICEQS
jgi:hypothetical protein